jgi:hypothetical protein
MCFLTDIVITVILRVLSTFLTYFPRNQMVPLVFRLTSVMGSK